MMKKIKKYYHTKEGYNPFLIREGWQVAQLNYLPKHGFDDVDKVEVHKQTDEVFILMNGEAILIEAEINTTSISFEFTKMEKLVTYNIPSGTWHNIAMSKEARVIIVENSNTHLNDVGYIALDNAQQQIINSSIQAALNK
ncbi:MAG: hypothetical protein PHX08_11355 [Lachnospiraceae bacterium]|nr:hypothetical protein [Lachnospiraceae bacterium]